MGHFPLGIDKPDLGKAQAERGDNVIYLFNRKQRLEVVGPAAIDDKRLRFPVVAKEILRRDRMK